MQDFQQSQHLHNANEVKRFSIRVILPLASTLDKNKSAQQMNSLKAIRNTFADGKRRMQNVLAILFNFAYFVPCGLCGAPILDSL